ncbi:hypothetical protein EDC01DRAFT_679354 [Geopyxis carbonaria]|nr:hypothetical protein EDC01DRAFT_679354 [Geopyxis carbonaria]
MSNTQPTWNSYGLTAITGGLLSVLCLLLASLCGPFLLRIFYRRDSHIQPTMAENNQDEKASFSIPEPVGEKTIEDTQTTADGFQESPQQPPQQPPAVMDSQLLEHYNFISQLPLPSLSLASCPGPNPLQSTFQTQNVFRQVSNMGDKTVLEEHSTVPGRKWKRRMVVYTHERQGSGSSTTSGGGSPW